MYRQHHKSQHHILRQHIPTSKVWTLDRRGVAQSPRKDSCGSCETCTDTVGSEAPELHPCTGSWAGHSSSSSRRGRGKGRGEQWLRGWGEGRAWAATAETGRHWRRLDWALGERGGFSAFSSETRLQQPGRQSDRRWNCWFIWADVASSCNHWKASTR